MMGQEYTFWGKIFCKWLGIHLPKRTHGDIVCRFCGLLMAFNVKRRVLGLLRSWIAWIIGESKWTG